jgi:hypothetical protein
LQEFFQECFWLAEIFYWKFYCAGKIPEQFYAILQECFLDRRLICKC